MTARAWLSLLTFGVLCGCTKEPLPLPPANHAGAAPRPVALEPASSADSAGAFVYRGVVAGAADTDTPPSCPSRGAPYPGQAESIVLRSARTPFLRFEIDGYVRSCLDRAKVEIRAGESWKEVAASPPRAPAVSLDGTAMSGEMCDVVSCMKIGRPLCVPLVDFEKVDSQTNEYQSRPLHGEVRVQFPYYTDAECRSAKLAEHRVLL
jgi:hypothetical protein